MCYQFCGEVVPQVNTGNKISDNSRRLHFFESSQMLMKSVPRPYVYEEEACKDNNPFNLVFHVSLKNLN